MNQDTGHDTSDQSESGGSRGVDPETRAVRRDLKRLRRRVARRRKETKLIESQIAILREETKPLTSRLATAGGDPNQLETDRGIASYVLPARMHRRHNTTGVHKANDLREPILQLYSKTAARAFAEQHGVLVPASLGTWPTPGDIDWDSLPDRFVIKSSRGGGGVAVFPLERRGHEFYDFIASEVVTQEQVTEQFWKKNQEDAVYFAEEFLVGKVGTGVPDDIKVFCFYGEVGYIEVRSEDWSRSTGTMRKARAFAPDGTELKHARALIDTSDDLLPPQDFSTLVEVSARLSGAIRRPIERIDFYETHHGIVFGEVTQNPGRPPALVPDWDRRLGDLYEGAAARLFADLVNEGHLSLEYGGLDGTQADVRQSGMHQD